MTTNWWKEERPDGAVFLDYNQNAKDRTIAAAYSVRGSAVGRVSTPELGDLHAGIDDAVWDIEPLLDMADRDEADRGLGDAPYPPNFPKQEGEPPRVQPSRMNKANWAGSAAASDEVEPQQLD